MSKQARRPGRPTMDPKHARITIRVSEEDIAALEVISREDSVSSMADSARHMMRAGLVSRGAYKNGASGVLGRESMNFDLLMQFARAERDAFQRRMRAGKVAAAARRSSGEKK